MDFTNKTLHSYKGDSNGAITFLYYVDSDPTKPHYWPVPANVDLSSYDFDIPEYEAQLIAIARLNYTPTEE